MLLEFVEQPLVATAGDRLKHHLSDAAAGTYHTVVLVAAFAKRAGMARLLPELSSARAAGCTVTGILGIDHGGTSKEGLEDAYDACDALYVVHSTRMDVTFHPKAYLFEGSSSAVLVSGSSNMTAGGLFTNIELCTQVRFDLPADATLLHAVKNWIQHLTDSSQPHIVQVDGGNLPAILNMLPPEKTAPTVVGTGGAANSTGSNLFGAGSFASAPSLPSTPPAQLSAPGAAPPASGSAVPMTQTSARGWKKLSSFDVHTKQAPGSIVIPKALWLLFPAFQSSGLMPSGVVQSEASFQARFIDGANRKVGTRRVIEYRPAVTHQRPNIERRLAFHDSSINPQGLIAGDVLIFELLQNDPEGALMNIERVRPTDPRYGSLPGIVKARAHGLLP